MKMYDIEENDDTEIELNWWWLLLGVSNNGWNIKLKDRKRWRKKCKFIPNKR